MATILITGGRGLVGKHLCVKLQKRGYDVAILSRVKKQDTTITYYTFDLNKNEIEIEAIRTADYIIHLAGANVANKRWTAKRKQLIINSRVKTSKLIFSKIKEHNKNLKAFISASAIGYYGTITSDKIFTETDSPSNDFLGKTCQQWEKSADKFSELSIRTVIIRTGVVLTKQGGALSKMIKPGKMGFGAAIGTGNQYLPWIHIDDLCNIYLKAIEDSQMSGIYNAVAPSHTTNKEFTQILSKLLKKPYWLPNIPAFIIKLLFGKMSEILLKGSRISSDKIKQAGYNFVFPDLKKALNDLINNP